MKKLTIGLMCILAILTISMVASAQDDLEDIFGDSSSDAAWTFLGLGLTVCLIIFIVPLIIGILICIWLYKDAEKRGKSGALWVILLILLSLFLSFIGLIIILVVWLAIRPPIGGAPVQQVQQPGPGRTCPNCGRAIPMDARACPYCAKKFDES